IRGRIARYIAERARGGTMTMSGARLVQGDRALTDQEAVAERAPRERTPGERAAAERASAAEGGPGGVPEDRFLNRELSWLDFNARVLALAEDRGLPLLERVKFLAIFASNLDEFYMVRVAGLKRRQSTGLSVRSPDGLTVRQQLARIAARTQDLVQ